MGKEIRNVLRRFVSISGYCMLALFIFGPVLNILDGINNIQIASVTLCAAVAALSSLVFLSEKELTGTAWWVRELLCLLINMTVSIPVTWHAGLWQTMSGMNVVLLIIIAIAFGNHLIEFLFDLQTASQLNRKLKELR